MAAKVSCVKRHSIGSAPPARRWPSLPTGTPPPNTTQERLRRTTRFYCGNVLVPAPWAGMTLEQRRSACNCWVGTLTW